MAFVEGECWWDKDFQAVIFEATEGELRVLFQITGSWLNDRLKTSDTKEMAITNFKAHQTVLTRHAVGAMRALERTANGRLIISKDLLSSWPLMKEKT